MAQPTLREENIPFAISQIRFDHQVPTLSSHHDGGQCRVFRVNFVDGKSWAVRVPLFVRNLSRETIIDLVQCEADILRDLENKGFHWAPKLQGCSLTFDNAVGYPFIALTWIPGSPLSWSEGFPTRSFRDKILNQVAIIHVSLIECTKENSMFDFFSNSLDARPAYSLSNRRHCHRAFYENHREQDPPSPQWLSSRNNRTGLF